MAMGFWTAAFNGMVVGGGVGVRQTALGQKDQPPDGWRLWLLLQTGTLDKRFAVIGWDGGKRSGRRSLLVLVQHFRSGRADETRQTAHTARRPREQAKALFPCRVYL